MSHHQVSALHRVVVGVCSALILVLAVGSLFEKNGPTEDPETHAPLDPRGAAIGIPIGLGGLIFSVAGMGLRRRRRTSDYRSMETGQRAMPRVDRIDTFAREVRVNQRAREQRKVFWTTPQRDNEPRKRPGSN
jgi:hypothetical protein